jgi:hypothetical protein
MRRRRERRADWSNLLTLEQLLALLRACRRDESESSANASAVVVELRRVRLRGEPPRQPIDGGPVYEESSQSCREHQQCDRRY